MRVPLATALLLVGPTAGWAQLAQPLDDVRVLPRPGSVAPVEMVSFGNGVLFSGLGADVGRELFRSDGTASGTSPVRDLARGPAASSNPGELASAGSIAYFVADDGALGRELWRTDGTEAGTVLVADIAPGPASSSPTELFVRGSEVFFAADDGVHGSELWRSNGTPEGTVLVEDLWPGRDSGRPNHFTVGPGGDLYFGARVDIGTDALCRSNGTVGGTVQLRAMPVLAVAYAGGKLFVASGRVFTSDGTAVGTQVVPGDYSVGTLFAQFAVVGADVYFAGRAVGTPNVEVFRTDGTFEGTVRVKPFLNVLTNSFEQDHSADLFAAGPYVYFWGHDGTTGGIGYPYRTDGTEAGTIRLTPDSAGSWPAFSNGNIGSFDGSAFFMLKTATGQALWRSDGTPGGTVLVLDLPSSVESPSPHALLTGTSSRLFFAAVDSAMAQTPFAIALWASDGGGAGTAPIAVDTVSSVPLHPLAVGTHVVFRADADAEGREWRAGTVSSSGSTLLTTSCAGPCSAYGDDQAAFLGLPVAGPRGAVLGDRLYFGHSSKALGFELWSTDGTPAGTVVVADVNPGAAGGLSGSPVVSNGTLFFRAAASGTDLELWASDGSPSGTRLVLDIRPGPSPSVPDLLTDVQGRLFFAADDGVHGRELWMSDGTAAGTTLVADLALGSQGISASSMAAVNGRAVFTAPGGMGGALWTSDGTAAGTAPLTSFGSVAASLVAAAGHVYFTLTDPDHGTELWSTNGITAGLVRDIAVGPVGSFPRGMVAGGAGIFFSAFDPDHGVELWTSDGTPQGTVRVADIAPGPASSSPRDLVVADGRVWFSAETPAHGREIWTSAGTAAGTGEVVDLVPGPGSSSPYALTAAADWLFFAATDGTHGYEPWALPLLPTLVAEDVTVAEQVGGAIARPVVRLVGTHTTPVAVGYATAAGTATAGEDFLATSGALTFAPGGPVAQDAPVPILDDAIDEDDQDFRVLLYGVSGAVLGTGATRVTIADDDGPPALIADPLTVVEGDTGPSLARFALRLYPHSERTASVAFATVDGSATAPGDYGSAMGTVTFAPGVPSQSVDVLVVGDTKVEPTETFALTFGSPQGLVPPAAPAGALILDDDGVGNLGQELSHGVQLTRIALAPARFRLDQRAFASYEVVLDAASGDALPATLDRLASDGSTVVQQGVAEGTGASRSLRWQAAGADEIWVAVAPACDPCTAAETYRLRAYETTLAGPRFNDGGTQHTFVVLFNRGPKSIQLKIHFWSEGGAHLHTRAFELAATGGTVFDVSQEPALVGRAGSITVSHDGRYGDLVGKAVALDEATGLSFDHPLMSRPR